MMKHEHIPRGLLMKKIGILCVALSVGSMGLYAQVQTIEPFVLPSARMAALGGAHAASVNGLDAIFENPAGFVSEQTELGLAALVINPSGPIFDIAGLILGGSEDMLTMLPALFDANGRLYVQADMLGPLAFGYVGKGLGFGLFNRSVVSVNAASLLSVTYSVSEEFLLTGGYAYRFFIGSRQKIELGLMPKGFVRASIGETISLDGIMSLVADPASIMTGTPLTMTSGIGFDVGARWSIDDTLAVALVARDAYSPAMVTTYSSFDAFTANPQEAMVGVSGYAVVPANLAFGVGYNAPFALLDLLGAELMVLVDYVDILDLLATIPRNPILNIGIGVELKLLDILALRAGIKDALPTAGFGIDLTALEFSLAMYGRELGMEPGARPVYNLLVALDFRY